MQGLKFKAKFLQELTNEKEIEKLLSFEASYRWAQKFAKRNGIKSKLIQGIQKVIEEKARNKIKAITDLYSQKIFSMLTKLVSTSGWSHKEVYFWKMKIRMVKKGTKKE